MKLLGTTTSPYTRKIRVLARAAQLPLELIDTRTLEGAELLARHSPVGKIPALLVEGELGALGLIDSGLIAAWLWARHEGALRAGGVVLDPADFEDRVRVEIVEGALDAAINRFYLRKDGVEEVGYVAKQGNRVRTCLEWIDGRVALGRPLKASTLALGCFLDWALFRGVVDLTPYEGLRRFRDEWRASGFGDESEPRE